VFEYVRCRACGAVFVDPVPDDETMAVMYAKSSYHDRHYADCESEHYGSSARLLRRFLPTGACVLDYGCGMGLFLKALRSEDFMPVGVEFDREACAYAGATAQCQTFLNSEFLARNEAGRYDGLHLGDVLEHLPDPVATLRELLTCLRREGFLFVEGPLENNASLVSYAAHAFGFAKRRLRPHSVGTSPPTHLLRVSEAQQLKFFEQVHPNLEQLYWEVYETGWPYAGAGALKQLIAAAAIASGGASLAGVTLGNRFRGIFKLAR
jgi:2-polyprenyl-3-methyl-5-hydroxy-6-metoxy-1,4-benzoquinol methylase